MDRYIIHCAVTVQNRKADSENKNKTKRTRTNKTKQQKTRQHGWWSADQFIVLAMYSKDDSFVSPRDWYGRGKTNNKNRKTTTMPYRNLRARNQQKHNAETKAPPSQEPRDHKVQPHGQHSHRLLDMIPKPVMTQSYGTWERENRGSET